MAVKSYKNSKEKGKALQEIRNRMIPEHDLRKVETAVAGMTASDLKEAQVLLKVALEKIDAHNKKLRKMSTRIERTPVKA